MSSSLDRIRQILRHDLDLDFIEAASIAIPWEYAQLYEELAADVGLSDAVRFEEFALRRAGRIVSSLVRTAERFGIPYWFRRLECNGQSKLLLKIGRVVLIQEPMLTLSDHPRASEYKRGLAESNAIVRQLELDLGDRPLLNTDWSGDIFAVLLHGSSGPAFTKDQKMLGGLMLAVPDARYEQWVVRLDLRKIAMFGRPGRDKITRDASDGIQADKVFVVPKAGSAKRFGS